MHHKQILALALALSTCAVDLASGAEPSEPGEPVTLGSAPRVLGPSVEVNPAGDAVVAWRVRASRRADIASHIEVVRVSSSGEVGQTQTLPADTGGEPFVAANPLGGAIVVWRRTVRDGDAYEMEAVRVSPEGLTGSVEVLDRVAAPPIQLDSPSAVVDSTGAATVVWSGPPEDAHSPLVPAVVKAIRIAPDGSVGELLTVSSDVPGAFVGSRDAHVAIDDSDQVTIAWRNPSRISGPPPAITAMRLLPGGGAGPTSEIPNGGSSHGTVRVLGGFALDAAPGGQVRVLNGLGGLTLWPVDPGASSLDDPTYIEATRRVVAAGFVTDATGKSTALLRRRRSGRQGSPGGAIGTVATDGTPVDPPLALSQASGPAPRLATGGSATVAVWQTITPGGNDQIRIRRLDQPSSQAIGSGRRPAISIDASGRAAVAWVQSAQGRRGTSLVSFARVG